MPFFDKHFTLEEACALLPEVRAAFRQIEDLRVSLGIRVEEIQSLMEAAGGNGGGKKSGKYLSEILELNSVINKLTKQGILIKDINTGLVDFPHIRDGKEVFLCWRVGEETIEYWHDLDRGYAGRQKL